MLSGIFYGLRTSLSVGRLLRHLRDDGRPWPPASPPPIFGGRVETLIMRLVDLQLSFPNDPDSRSSCWRS